MNKRPKLNKRLLRRIRNKIAKTPEAYDQTTGGAPSVIAPCGTVACIAGWAVALSLPTNGPVRLRRMHWQNIRMRAQKLLGLTTDEANVLFTANPNGRTQSWWPSSCLAWPEKFSEMWNDSIELNEPEQRPQIAVAYLDEILATGKVLLDEESA